MTQDISDMTASGTTISGMPLATTSSATAFNPLPTVPSAISAFIEVPGSTKMQHKGTICRVYSNPFTIRDSIDRLKRVRGLAQYNERLTAFTTNKSTTTQDDSNLTLVAVEDPAVTLVRCNNLVFAAIIQLTGIRLSGNSIPAIHLEQLHEPNVRLRGQIMAMVSCADKDSHQPDQPDWEWNGLYAPGQDLDDISGSLVEPINPTLQLASCKELEGSQTITVRTSELRAIAALVFERAHGQLPQLRTVSVSTIFPYTTHDTGEACFVCESDVGSRSAQPDYERCVLCLAFRTVDISVPVLLRHMGAHILHDPKLKGTSSPCGWCLRSGPGCAVYVRKNGRDGYKIDPDLSRCQSGVRVFSFKPASEFTKRSPCTNHPLLCPLCLKGSPAVWKYNFLSHICTVHPTANPELYKELYQLDPAESTLMKEEYLKKHRNSKSAKKQRKILKISEAHSSRVALR